MAQGKKIIGYSSLIVLTGLGVHYGLQHASPMLIQSYSSRVSSLFQTSEGSAAAQSSNTSGTTTFVVQRSAETSAAQPADEQTTPQYLTVPQVQTDQQWSRRGSEQPSNWQSSPTGSVSGTSGNWNSVNVSLPRNTQPSSNWAGYIDAPKQSQSYTSVSGSWTVPAASAVNSQMGAAAQWIGLGGVSSSDLLQVGTLEQAVNGQETATVFWEQLPSTAQQVMQVPVGSQVTAKIQHTSGLQWRIQFSATTPQGKHLGKTVPVTLTQAYEQGIGTSAEWISEDPSNVSNQLYPLATTGTVKFSNATVNGVALGNAKNQVSPVALVGSYGTVLASPSGISANGNSFSTTTNASALISSSGVTRGASGYVQYGGGRGRGYWTSEGMGSRRHASQRWILQN